MEKYMERAIHIFRVHGIDSLVSESTMANI